MKCTRRKVVILFLILMNIFNTNFVEYSNSYETLSIFSFNNFYLNYIVYTDRLTYNGITTYSDFENKTNNLDNLGLFLNFTKSTEIEYECHIKYNFYNYSFEGELDFNTVDYTFHSINDSTEKLHIPFFNPPNIKRLKHYPFMTFSRDEPSILYFEGSDDYLSPFWVNYQLDIPDQQGVYLYHILPKHPETLRPSGDYEFENDYHFLVAGGFSDNSLPLFLELSNSEIANLTIDISPSCYLRETSLPLKEYNIVSSLASDIGIILIFVIIGIAGIGSFLFMRQRRKMVKKSWKKKKKRKF